MRLQSFVRKLFKIVNDENTNHIVSWTNDKNENLQTFTIHNTELFTDRVLPSHFKHGNIQSFSRQLNKYQFVKHNKGKLDRLVFSHPNFRKDGDESQLVHIQRRSSVTHDLEDGLVGHKRLNLNTLEEDQNIVQKHRKASLESQSPKVTPAAPSDDIITADEAVYPQDEYQMLLIKLFRDTVIVLQDIIKI